MRMQINYAWLFLLQLFITPFLNAQESSFKNYVVSNWGMEEGLPQSSVNDIIQTKDGYIWLATFGGLVRFDGLSFTTFNRSNTEGLRSDRILQLFEATNGDIWITTEDGLIRYQNKEFKSFVLGQEEFQVYSPLTLDEDDKGRLWISSHSRIFKFEDESFIEVAVSKNINEAKKALSNNAGAILTFHKQVYRSMGDSVYQVINLEDDISNSVIISIEYPENSARYLIATNGDGVVKYENGEIATHSLPEFLPFNEIWDFSIDKSGQLWILGYGGLGIWKDAEIKSIYIPSEVGDADIISMLEDNEGNIWFGSGANGLFKLRPSNVKNIDKKEGLNTEQMLSLLAMKNGNYLFSTNCGGVFEWDGDVIRIPPISSFLPNKCNWSVFEDSQNRIWFGSRILYRTNSIEEPGIEIDSTHGFNGIDIFVIMEDSKNIIWIGASNGLYKYDGSNFQRFSTKEGLSFNDVRTLFEDKSGALWVGTSNGLNKLKNDKITQIYLDEEKNQIQEPNIRAIHEDESGVMWFGTYGNGLFRLFEGKVTNIRAKDGLFKNVVSHIIEDDYGNFWMGSNNGISRVSKEELNNFSEGKISTIQSYSYGRNDGMKSAETNGGFQPNVIKDENGKIYFPTVAGVAVISTQEANPDVISPPTFIERIRSSTTTFDDASEISLPYNDAFLEIRFTALMFSDPKKLRFRYRLVGLSSNWIDIGNQRHVLFSNIPPGNYIFEVVPNKSNGTWSENSASINIQVIPPFWQTSWFYSLIGVIIIFLGPAIYYVRTRALTKENDRQRKFTEKLIESQEIERRRIASELHDGIGQQVLVIKNRAELAKSFSGDPNEVQEQLAEIIKSAISSIADVRSISHNLRPVHLEKFGLTEALNYLCEQINEAVEFELSYYFEDIDGVLQSENEINFYRVIQEALNNIIKHAGASEASITVQKVKKNIITKIWDDGKGFKMVDIEHLSGLGFLGMKERIDSLKGELSIKSRLRHGTTIIITIPIK